MEGRKEVDLVCRGGLYLVYDGFVLFLLFVSEVAASQDKEPLLSMSLSLPLFTYYMLPSELVEREGS